jgi:hypothetical protein
MQEEAARFAKRCLPLTMANQAGWWVVLHRSVRALWNGSPETRGIEIAWEGEEQAWAHSHFGCGILTFSLPWLFATSLGWDLHVRGPANWVKDGIVPLEGLVETDWSPMTFTMNWKFTRPGPVRFAAGEPIAQIAPCRRDLLACGTPRLLRVEEAPQKLQDGYRDWVAGRAGFLAGLARGDKEMVDAGWQKTYTKEARRTRPGLCGFEKTGE